MKIDFDQQLQTLDGEPLPASIDDPTPISLKAVCLHACLATLDGDAKQTGQAAKLFSLAVRLNKGGVVEVEAEDVSLIKRRAEQLFGPLVVGQVANLLESRERFVTAPEKA